MSSFARVIGPTNIPTTSVLICLTSTMSLGSVNNQTTTVVQASGNSHIRPPTFVQKLQILLSVLLVAKSHKVQADLGTAKPSPLQLLN